MLLEIKLYYVYIREPAIYYVILFSLFNSKMWTVISGQFSMFLDGIKRQIFKIIELVLLFFWRWIQRYNGLRFLHDLKLHNGIQKLIIVTQCSVKSALVLHALIPGVHVINYETTLLLSLYVPHLRGKWNLHWTKQATFLQHEMICITMMNYANIVRISTCPHQIILLSSIIIKHTIVSIASLIICVHETMKYNI